jgi:quinol monooxygenase YgiN
MTRNRRLAAAAVCLALLGFAPSALAQPYGTIGSLIAQPGRRDELIQILAKATAHMPGCLAYVVAADADKPDLIWVTEIWVDQASHDASLKLPAVQAAIAAGRPLIAGFGVHAQTLPLAGLPAAPPP